MAEGKSLFINDDIEEDVLNAVLEMSYNSTRCIVQHFSINKFSVVNILNKNSFHSYHLQLCQELIGQTSVIKWFIPLDAASTAFRWRISLASRGFLTVVLLIDIACITGHNRRNF